MDYTPDFRKKYENAPPAVRNMLVDILTDSILSSDNIPEEIKIEVRIMAICREVEATVHKAMDDFACPLPSFDPEGSEVQRRVFPARQQFLEYMQLVQGGLNAFLQQCPPPDIPARFRDMVNRRHDRS